MRFTIAAGAYAGTYNSTMEASKLLAEASSTPGFKAGDTDAVCAVMEMGILNGQIVKVERTTRSGAL